MRSNVNPAPVVVDQRYSGSDGLLKPPAQAEETPNPVMCCSRLDSSTVMSEGWAVPPPQVGLEVSFAASVGASVGASVEASFEASVVPVVESRGGVASVEPCG